jgi:hypothetical protein
MRVKAIAQGYYNDQLVYEGQVFEIKPKLDENGDVIQAEIPKYDSDGKPLYDENGYPVVDQVEVGSEEAQFSPRWMEKLEGDDAEVLDDPEQVAVTKARTRPAKVQQAPDARDVFRTIDETLEPEQKVEFSGGPRNQRRPRALSSIRAAEVAPASDEEGQPRNIAKGGRKAQARGLKSLFSKQGNEAEVNPAPNGEKPAGNEGNA